MNYTEQAQLIVKAESDEAARENVLKTFAHIPGIEVISVEDAPEDAVKAAIEHYEQETPKVLN